MYCECGCGQITPIADRTANGTKRGNHCRFVRGHNSKRMVRRENLLNKQFGSWLVTEFSGFRGKHPQWTCICSVCGEVRIRTSYSLKKSIGYYGCGKCGNSLSHVKFRPFESKYRALHSLNKKRMHVVIDLTYEEFLTFTNHTQCHYCGDNIPWHPYRGSNYWLDRKDNSRGYSLDNCVVCCARCNKGKSNHFSYEEWVEIGNLIRGWKK